jgi:hypothetical protein
VLFQLVQIALKRSAAQSAHGAGVGAMAAGAPKACCRNEWIARLEKLDGNLHEESPWERWTPARHHQTEKGMARVQCIPGHVTFDASRR